jgi:hypothetical protein
VRLHFEHAGGAVKLSGVYVSLGDREDGQDRGGDHDARRCSPYKSGQTRSMTSTIPVRARDSVVSANIRGHLTVTVGLDSGPLDGRGVAVRRGSHSFSVPSNRYRPLGLLSSDYRSFRVDDLLTARRRGG